MSIERADTNARASIRFDLFELDFRNSQLRRSGLPVDLPPQALRVLTMLAERPDELVSRKQIKEALWPGQSYGDFDSRLNFTIKKLREALGDDAERPRYIRTVRNAGYILIAPVRELQTPGSADIRLARTDSSAHSDRRDTPLQPTQAASAVAYRLRSGTKTFPLAVAAFVLIALGATALLVLRQHEPGASAADSTSAKLSRVSVEYEPHIVSVSPIVPAATQRIVIRGKGFGLHVPYVHTDSPYLAIRDLTTHWAAGRIVPHNSDEVMLDVESWMDNEIVVEGFCGDYGLKGWKLALGDELEIAVWNPQSGAGPALFHLTVTSVP